MQNILTGTTNTNTSHRNLLFVHRNHWNKEPIFMPMFFFSHVNNLKIGFKIEFDLKSQNFF